MAEQEFADFEIDQDFEKVKEFGGGGFDLVPPGEYTLDIVNVERKDAKTSGAPMVVVTFQVPDDAAAHAGAKLWGNYTLGDKAIGRLKQLMMAAGCSLDKFRASELMGARIVADVIHTPGQATPDAQGNVQPARVFANVVNERAVEVKTEETKPVAAKTTAPKPPIANGQKPATTGATRRT